MASRSNLVNLDAMIKRDDFSAFETKSNSFEVFNTISVRDFTTGAFTGPNLRKPDFQRETNHWTPDQIVSLLECYANGDLIPSVILWRSPTSLFVIDGGHRLSVIKAWIEDDYGDGPISQIFFGYDISNEQKKNAIKTRNLVNEKIGSWKHIQTRSTDDSLSILEKTRITTIMTRGLPIQWVDGNADKAESSFFKINTKGTPLDEIEELLLKNRNKPIPISARAIIRAGKGHKYWSKFSVEVSEQIESLATDLHSTLFDPEIKRPIKTLDLPLGGPKGVRTALQALIDLSLIATRNQIGSIQKIENTAEDLNGLETIGVLSKMLELAKRITGNDGGSLGLHPAVYFYGPTGRHSSPMFMGTMTLIGKKLSNNDKDFFRKFSLIRSKLELILIRNKDLIATTIQKHVSSKRIDNYASFLDQIIQYLQSNDDANESALVEMAGLEGKIVVGNNTNTSKSFSDDTKSEIFINVALKSAIKCTICSGYLDTEKSVSYDHIVRSRDGGLGVLDNIALTHPYCNQSIKS